MSRRRHAGISIHWREVVALVHAGTSGPTIREVLARYGATIVGGAPAIGPRGAYIVSVPDPGPTYEAVSGLKARLPAEPGVSLVYVESYRGKGILRRQRGGTR